MDNILGVDNINVEFSWSLKIFTKSSTFCLWKELNINIVETTNIHKKEIALNLSNFFEKKN